MILAALPRFSGERYAQMFSDRPVPATAILLYLDRAQTAAPEFADTLTEIKARGLKEPGTRYAGAFVISDAVPDLTNPQAKLVAFTFVKD